MKVSLSKQWNQAFERAEIPLTMRTPDTLTAQWRYGPFSERIKRTQDPSRAVNNGTRVFGEAGAWRVSIVGLAEELNMHGYGLVDVHRLGYTWQPSRQLVLAFEKDGEGVAFPWDLFHTFTTACFGDVQVWANPRNPKGLVVHTVQGRERDEQASPQWHLAFDRGAWKLAAISFPRADQLLAHRCA